MARQSQTPVQFNRTTRADRRVGMTSGRAGVVLPIDYIPILRGDSASGQFMASFDLAEMPKPLMNAVSVNVQAWFVPKTAHPQFSGYDEFMHSYHGEQISAAGQADRDPPPFFSTVPDPEFTNYRDSTFLRTLGIHLLGWNSPDRGHNADLVDAYSLVWNFRAAAHSSRLPRRPYVVEDAPNAINLAQAFWPTGKFRHMVPDYERALVVGTLDLDVAAGQIPVSGIGYKVDNYSTDTVRETGKDTATTGQWSPSADSSGNPQVREDPEKQGWPAIYAELAGQTVGATLADIDKARTSQAFAKLRTAYAGNDATGFDNDDVLVAEMMSGFRVPEDMFKRPWLLDSQRVTFGMNERHATDAANLDQSVTKGRAQVGLSLNLPQQDVGGVIIITAEVLPEQLHERAGDPWLHINSVDEFPDALRDVQRPEPVDMVPSWRVDERHSTPAALYGYEPMNAKWDRDFTTLGGDFYQEDPANPFKESRAAIWLAEVVDPEFTSDHYLAPAPFPHDVFSDTLADAVEVSFRHSVAIRGLTQIGDVIEENNDDYDAVTGA